jgi:hypothetical protein
MTTTGTYEQLIGDFEDMPNHFFTTEKVKFANSISLGVNATASIEAGYTLVTRRKTDLLRLGIFIDYGLLNLKMNDPKALPLLDYRENPLDVVLGSHITAASKVHALMGGIKLTYLLRANGTRHNGFCQ